MCIACACVVTTDFPALIFFSLCYPVALLDSTYRENVIAFCRKTQPIDIKKLVFVDQTNMNESARPLYSLSPKGKKAQGSTVYTSFRCYGLDVLSPAERQRTRVKGYTKKRVLSWFTHTLAVNIQALHREEVVVVL